MASFQVEIPPPPPFACAAVHNRRDPFQNNLGKLDITDLWVHTPQWQASSASGSGSAATNNARNTTYPSSDGEAPAAEPIRRSSYASDSEATASTAEPNKPKDKWARAREIVFPSNTTPPKHSVEVSNAGGVSSLVQKWKGFEAGAKRPPPPPPPPSSAAIINDDDSVIGDWESDRTVLSGRSSLRGRDSDAAESERLRVVDIIKKLTPNEVGSVSPPRRCSLDHAELRCLPPPVPRLRTSLDHSDLRCLPTVGSSPRIRGRQAYIDLLVQAERERRSELQGLVTRKPVSAFSHRGRIQAALKIKLLRRGMDTKEAQPHFRERANSKAPNAPIHSRSRSKENIPNFNSDDQKQQNGTETCLKDDHLTASQHTPTTSKQQEIHHTSLESTTTNIDFLHAFEEFHHAETSFAMQEHNWESTTTKSAGKEAPKSEEIKEENEDSRAENHQGNHDIVETTAYWVSEPSHPEEGWEEFHYDDDQPNEANNNTDWIEMVSRPRSDWEYLRQERYQEMLDPFLDNEDIRVLLNRKSVSSFLSSNMRDKIDQLMISRTQGKTTVNNNIRQEKRQGQVAEKVRGREEDDEYFQEYEEAKSSQHYTECDDFTDSMSTSWSQNQGRRESSECSYQAASPSTRHRDRKGRNTHSIEMDVIYDLRREMEQLHQEMSELRKSIQCSTDMQIKLHRSIKKELNHHLDTKSGRRHLARKAKGRKCCMCRKGQVDCVIYKCGHMCTCFVCAHELQWNNGSCPICRAQIVDVIRTQS